MFGRKSTERGFPKHEEIVLHKVMEQVEKVLRQMQTEGKSDSGTYQTIPKDTSCKLPLSAMQVGRGKKRSAFTRTLGRWF